MKEITNLKDLLETTPKDWKEQVVFRNEETGEEWVFMDGKLIAAPKRGEEDG